MVLPVLFQQLVDEDEWVVVANTEHMMDRSYIIENDGIRFSIFEAKDAGPQFLVRNANSNGRAMHPKALAARLGQNCRDEIEAFYLIAKDRVNAKHELKSYDVRKRFLEPALILPMTPVLVLSILPLLRNRVLSFLDWWTNGPVKRLVD